MSCQSKQTEEVSDTRKNTNDCGVIVMENVARRFESIDRFETMHFVSKMLEVAAALFITLMLSSLQVSTLRQTTTTHQHAVFMVSTCSPTPHTASGDPLGINFDIMNKVRGFKCVSYRF